MDQATSMRVRAPELADWSLAHGRGSLTSTEAAELLGVGEDQVRRRLNAPARRGEWVQPTRRCLRSTGRGALRQGSRLSMR